MNEGKSTTNYLYKILHRSDDFIQRELINSFIDQINHSKIEISCGLFDINWKFLFKVGYVNILMIINFDIYLSVHHCWHNVFCDFNGI